MFFQIVPASIASDVAISGVSSSYPYTGKAITPKPTLKYNGMALKLGTDYTLSYAKNKAAGTASVTVKGKGNYTGSRTVKFKIAPQSLAAKAATISGVASSYIHTGKAITPKPTLKYNGMALKLGTDYTLSYAKNKAAGTASVTAKGKGNYAGSKTVKFKITKAKQPMTVAVKTKTKTVKYASVKKKALAFSPLTVKKPAGKVTYKNVSANKKAKKFKISAKGKVTIPKGTKRGTYKLNIKVSAAGSANYKAGSKTVAVTVKVK